MPTRRRADRLTELDRQTLALGLALLVQHASDEGVTQNVVNVAQKLAILTPTLGALVSINRAMADAEDENVDYEAWLKVQGETFGPADDPQP